MFHYGGLIVSGVVHDVVGVASRAGGEGVVGVAIHAEGESVVGVASRVGGESVYRGGLAMTGEGRADATIFEDRVRAGQEIARRSDPGGSREEGGDESD